MLRKLLHDRDEENAMLRKSRDLNNGLINDLSGGMINNLSIGLNNNNLGDLIDVGGDMVDVSSNLNVRVCDMSSGDDEKIDLNVRDREAECNVCLCLCVHTHTHVLLCLCVVIVRI